MTSIIHNPHLEGKPFFWQGGPLGVLLVHGFTATTAEVRPLAKALHEKGYTVSGPLLPGHYTTPEDLNRVRWQDWVASIETSYQKLKACCQTVIVGGESTGGVLSLYLAADHPEIQAILLYAPALRLQLTPFQKLQLHLLSPFIAHIPKDNLDSSELWQGYPVNPLKGAIQLLRLQRQVKPRLAQVHQPVLIIQGRLDNTVHPEVPDYIYRQIGSSVKEKYWMDNSAHCVIIDREYQQVVHITLDFIQKTINNSS